MSGDRSYPDLGNYASEETFAATSLSTTGSTGALGDTRISRGNRYQLMQLVDATATIGDVVYIKSASGFTCTPTIGNSSAGEVAGIICATGVVSSYYWIKQGGTHSVKANGVFADGMPVWPDSGNNRVIPAGVFNGALSAAADTAGAILAVTNPCTGAWRVTSLVINRTTASSGAGTADFGIAANATTLNDGLIDGLNLNATAANNENNFANGGTNGKASQLGAAATVLTGSTASGNVAGLVGTYSGTFEPVGSSLIVRLRIIGIAQGTISAGKVSVYLDIPSIPKNG